MQPHDQLQTTTQYISTASSTYQQHIPWWNGLNPAAYAELVLPDIDALSSQRVDIVVVGAGVTGLSAALSARKAGASVLLLEREDVLGYGATGRNAGILSAGVNMGIADLPAASPGVAFWSETTQVLLSLIQEAAKPESILLAHLTGAISLAESQYAARKLAREARVRLATGLHAELWSPAQVAEATESRLNAQSLVKALWLPDEGRIHPLTLLAHLARQARTLGIHLAGQAHVVAYKEVTTRHSHSWELTLANGQHIATSGLIKAVGPTVQPNARIYALSFDIELPDTFPLFWDASPYTYADFRPGNGRLAVSGGRYGRAGITRNDAAYYNRLADAAHRWLPELAGQEPMFKWAVDLNVTANMIPEIHKLGDVAPGVAIEGLGALGVLPGIVLGRRAGELIARK